MIFVRNCKKIEILENIAGILLATIICMTYLRFFLNIYDSNVAIYFIYFSFILTVILIHVYPHDKIRINNEITIILICCVLVSLYAICSVFFDGWKSIKTAVKFLISIGMGICAYKLSIKTIKKTIFFSTFYTLYFSLFVLIYPLRVGEYLSSGSNYLNLTFPVGLILTVFLCRGIYYLNYKTSCKKKIICLFFVAVFFLMLMQFTARSSILLPFITAFIIAFMIGKHNYINMLRTIFVLVISILLGSHIFVRYSDPYILSRMLRLFENIASEDRIIIWSDYVKKILINKWYILGGGIESAEIHTGYYPHNLYLQYVGELGLMGLVACIVITGAIILLVKKSKIYFLIKNSRNIDGVLFYEILGGLLYLFFSFLKSFSIYDGYLLYIFISLMLKICICCIDEKSKLFKRESQIVI